MYRFEAVLWEHDGDAAWHFVTLPGELSDEIEDRTSHRRAGFGSVRVRVTTGSTTWATSLFPDTKREAYVLPVKKDVRTRESLTAGDTVSVELDLIDS